MFFIANLSINDFNRALEENEFGKAISILNNLWFRLPDGTFNIMNNPQRWNGVISLLEEKIKQSYVKKVKKPLTK